MKFFRRAIMLTILKLFLLSAVSKSTFLAIGSKYTKTKSKEIQRNPTRQRRFKSFFGVTPHVCFLVWQRIKNDAPPGSEPKHLLWCLNFLKQYSDEHTRKAVRSAVEKTIRKWTWIFVKLVSDLNVVSQHCVYFHGLNKIHIYDILHRLFGKTGTTNQFKDKFVSFHSMESILKY